MVVAVRTERIGHFPCKMAVLGKRCATFLVDQDGIERYQPPDVKNAALKTSCCLTQDPGTDKECGSSVIAPPLRGNPLGLHNTLELKDTAGPLRQH